MKKLWMLVLSLLLVGATVVPISGCAAEEDDLGDEMEEGMDEMEDEVEEGVDEVEDEMDDMGDDGGGGTDQ